MTELEKRIDFVKDGIKALRAGWKDLRRLMNDVAKAYPEDSEIRAKFLSDIKVIGKFVRGVRPATLHPTLDEFRASLKGAEASLAEGLLLLKIFEIESHAVLARRGDVDSASEPDPIRTAPDQRSTDQWDDEDREILARVLPAEPCVLCERVAADRVMWDDDYSVGFHQENPISTGHAVITPRRHERDFFALPEPARHEMWTIAKAVRAGVAEDHAPDGWRVVIYSGHDVDHAQVHLIPRYAGDIPSSRGEPRRFSSDPTTGRDAA